MRNSTTPSAGALDRLLDVAVEVADLAELLALRDVLAGPDLGDPEARGRRCSSHSKRVDRASSAAGPARPGASSGSAARCGRRASSCATARLLELPGAAGLGDHAAARLRPPTRVIPGSASVESTTYGSPNASASSRDCVVAVERERLERLDQVAAVQVEHGVRGLDQLVKMSWASRSVYVPSGSPGKARLRFLPSAGTTNGERCVNDSMLTTGTRGDRARELRRVELAHDARHGGDRGVLAAVDAADQRDPRAVLRAARPRSTGRSRPLRRSVVRTRAHSIRSGRVPPAGRSRARRASTTTR